MIKRVNPGLIVMAMLLVLVGAGSAWADLTDGLVAHWKLDGDATDSAGSNDGTTVNGPVWTTGKIGGALGFDGINDYVSLSNNAVTTTEFTVSGWSNQFGLGGGVEYTNMIFAQNDAPAGNNHSAVMLYAERDGTARALIRSSSGTRQILTSPSKNYNEWHHYAMTVDSNDFIFYINGVEVARTTNNQAGNYTTSIDNVGIGRMYSNGENKAFFNGVIDEVRIYNRALSAGEVCQLYRGELLGLEIEGPDTVAENFQAQYKAIAFYERADIDVTDSADCVWSVEPNDNCSIIVGLLTTEPIDLPEEVTIYAEYSEDGNTVNAEKEVEIFAICPSGSALEFDGVDDYVDVADDDSLDITDEITISAWVKRPNYGTHGTIAGQNNSVPSSPYPTEGYGLFSYKEGFEFNFSSGTGGDFRRTTPRVPASANQWHHIVGTYDGNNAYLYIDGEQKASLGYVGTIVPAAGYPLNIGYWRPALPTYFNGKIDEIAIYNRALSAEEIQELMHTRPVAEPNLVAYWNFDEGEEQIAADSSGNGNDGTLGSGPGVDNSDPNWVDSVPPVGICSVEGIVERNLLNVLGMKNDVLDILDEAIGKEEALWEYMDTVFKDRDFGNTSKGAVVKAKQKILSAIQREEQAETTIGQSLEKLNDALDALDIN